MIDSHVIGVHHICLAMMCSLSTADIYHRMGGLPAVVASRE